MSTKNTARVRKALLKNLANCITVLVAHDDVAALDDVIDSAGYGRHVHQTSDELGRVLFALAQVIGSDDLIDVVYQASFRVSLVGEDALDKAVRSTRWELAEHTAATTLKECGGDVLARFIERCNAVSPDLASHLSHLRVVA